MTNSQKIKEKKSAIEKEIKKDLKSSQALKNISFGATAFRASTDMLSCIIVGTLLGYFIDRYFLSPHYGLIIGFILGAAAGLLNVYRRLCRMGYGFNRY